MTPTIYPVILPVPPEARSLPPRQRVQFLSRHAREALQRSAERMEVELGPLEKDPRGAPLPFKGNFWSLTHKPEYVGGVVAPALVGLDLEQVRSIVHFATGGLKPDLTILLDIDVELGLRRKRQAGGEWNRLDDYEVAFYQRVRRAYLEMARLEPERWVIIDASEPFDQVQAEIKRVILQRLAGG